MVRSDFQHQTTTSINLSPENGPSTVSKVEYFDVPYEENGNAKAHGLKWDSTARKWFAPTADIARKYSSLDPVMPTLPEEKVYFKVHFLQKDKAKELGMRFDGVRKKWFAPTPVIAARGREIFSELEG